MTQIKEQERFPLFIFQPVTESYEKLGIPEKSLIFQFLPFFLKVGALTSPLVQADEVCWT